MTATPIPDYLTYIKECIASSKSKPSLIPVPGRPLIGVIA